MKIINKILIVLLGTLAMGSCNYLEKEPDTEQTLELVFSSQNTTEDWLAGVYNGIANPTWEWTRNHGIEAYADDVYISYGWRQYWGSILNPIYGGWSTTTGFAEANYWVRMPQYIRQAYIFIQRAHALPGYITQTEIDLMKAECRFLAAYYYYVLLVNYGAIPVRELGDIASTDASIIDLQGGQWPFDKVVEYLEKEFRETAELLPPSYASGKYGRITSVICHTMRSKLLLFAASPLVNGNEDYKGHVNYEGVEIFNTDYKVDKWVTARDAIKQLLDVAHADGHKLYVALNNDGTIDPFTSLQDLWFVKDRRDGGNVEVLFPFTKSDNGNNFTEYTKHGFSHADDAAGNGGLGVYQGLVDAFFMKNGLPIDHPDSGYSEEGFTSGVESRNTKWDGGGPAVGNITMDHTFNMYANREPRFYLTVAYHGAWQKSLNRRLDFTLGAADNNGTHDAPQNGYLIRKKTHPDDHPKQNRYKGYSGFNTNLYRLGASYLDYAEALNEATDSPAARTEALVWLNQIRERAGVRKYSLTPVPASDPDFITVADTQDAVRNAVRMERRVELCTEGSRWYDIRRWLIAEDISEMNDYAQGMDFRANNETEFLRRTNAGLAPRVWRAQYYWQPINNEHIEENPNLIQNPKWTND